MRPTANRPGVALARALRDLGLTQGRDFWIRATYYRRERVGTYTVLTGDAARSALDNAEKITHATRDDGGWWFAVKRVDTGPDGGLCVLITNERTF